MLAINSSHELPWKHALGSAVFVSLWADELRLTGTRR